MEHRLIPILIISFLSGVALRSFFNVPMKWMLLGAGIILGFWLFERTICSLSGFFALFGTVSENRSTRAPRNRLSIPRLLSGRAPTPTISIRTSASVEEQTGAKPSERAAGRARMSEENKWFSRALLIALLFFLGTLRFSYFENTIADDQLHLRYGEEISIKGVVVSAKTQRNSQRLFVETDLGKTLVVKRPYPIYRYGDVLALSGKVAEPEPYNDFDTKAYLAKDGTYSQMIFPEIEFVEHNPPSRIFAALFSIRDLFEGRLKAVLPEPHASLANGMLLGNEGILPDDISESFRISGTVHILVLSGYNITVVGAVLASIFGFVPAVVGIISFVLMTGAEAPAVRAAIMGIIGLLIFKTGRPKTAMLVLLWSAVLMVAWNPAVLRFDRGFQLSFLATLGLIVASPFFTRILKFLPKTLGIRESATASFSAQLFVLPLIVSWGGEVSYLSPLANILVVGLVPAVMAFGFLGSIVAFFAVSVGSWIASASYVIISFQMAVAKFFAGLPQTTFQFNFLPVFILASAYVLLLYWAYRAYEIS